MSATANRAARVDRTITKPRLLFFHSSTSGKSRRAEGYLAQVLQHRRNHDTFDVTRVDVAQYPDLATRLQIVSVPAILIVEGKRVKACLDAINGAGKIETFLAPWLKR
jgi:thioredoxin-like negative regulator of GroEL